MVLAWGDFHMEGTAMGNPAGWFEIYVNDIERAKRFYQAVLEVQLTQLETPAGVGDMEMWAFPMSRDGYGASGALAKKTGVAAGGNSVIVYFSCKDCAVEAGRVAAAGGKVEKPKFSIGKYGHISLAFDTEGNLFGLHSME
jgi:predicted enzyme related to lactoylglutathione lyase